MLSKEPLKTKTENVGELIQKYGKIATFFGAKEALENIGKIFSEVDIDTLKKRIEKVLEEHKKRIVIYIDDIDRLDKTEIHTIFRLVKLTGDFSYTVYVLSFDKDMVASAIGERFGSGDKKAGENFLEKIIQIPLDIPKAQPEALKKFCFQLVDNALQTNKIELSDEEVHRFVLEFTTNVVPRLNTPRLAVRYGNTLSFSFPLLKDEVDMVDLMLIEAIRVFYPTYYTFIKNNPDYFIGSYKNLYDRSTNNTKVNEIKEYMINLGPNFTKGEQQKVIDLISNLFPFLEAAYNNYSFSAEKPGEWYLQKRIASTKYFNRYFSYTVIEGDISDIEFNLLLEKISNNFPVEEITKILIQILNKTTPDNFVEKLRSREGEYDWNSTKIISKAICDISQLFPSDDNLMFLYQSSFSQSAIFIFQLLKTNKIQKDLFQFAKELLLYPKDFNYAFELLTWFRSGERDNKIFNAQEINELLKILTERALNEAGQVSIIEKYPKHFQSLGHAWFERNKEEYESFVKSYLDLDQNNIIKFLKAFVPVISSSSKKNPYKGDITQDVYNFIASFNNVDDLFDRILIITSENDLDKTELFWNSWGDKEYSESNMLSQFIHWYKQDKKQNSR